MTPRVISFATDNGRYPKSANQLRQDCLNQRVPHWIETLPKWGKEKNERAIHKPTFVRRILEAWAEPALWLDADTRLYEAPAIEPGGEDVGLAPNPFPGSGRFLFTAGAIWFRNTERTHRFVRTWEQLSQAGYPMTGYGDHFHLIEAVARHLCDEETRFRPLSKEIAGVVFHGGDGTKEQGVLCASRY